MNLHLAKGQVCIWVYLLVNLCQVRATWGKEKQSFHTEISQAAKFMQLSCEAQPCYLKWEKVWVWFRNLLHPLTHSLIENYYCAY